MLLTCGGGVELAPNPGEPVVDASELLVDAASRQGERSFMSSRSASNDEATAWRKSRSSPRNSLHIAVGGAGKHAGGCRILRAGSQPRVQVADLCFQRGHTRFEALGLHTR